MLKDADYAGVVVVRDEGNNIVLVYVVNGTPDQTVVINQAALESAEQEDLSSFSGLRSYPNSFVLDELQIQNDSGEELKIDYIDENGISLPIFHLSPNTRYLAPTPNYGAVFSISDMEGNV